MPYVNTNSTEKGQAVLEKFIKANGVEESTASNVNLATSEVIENATLANKQDLINEIKKKTTPIQSDGEIVIPRNKKHCAFIFRTSVHAFDQSNPSYGIDGVAVKEIHEQVNQANTAKNEVFLIYGGDYCGIEEQIKYLNNAKLIARTLKTKTEEDKQKFAILYFGLVPRIKSAVNEITLFVKKHPNLNVLLFNGYQEHYVEDYFKYSFWDKVVEQLDPTIAKNVSKVRGVNTLIPIKRVTVNGEYIAYAGFLTNNGMLKSVVGNTAMNSIYRSSGTPCNDATTFVTTSPINGKRDKNIYCVSLDCLYIPSTKGKFNQPAPRGYNAFTLDVVGDNQIMVNEGLPMPINPLEQQLYNQLTIQSAVEDELDRYVHDKLAKAGKSRKTGTIEEFSKQIDEKQKELAESTERMSFMGPEYKYTLHNPELSESPKKVADQVMQYFENKKVSQEQVKIEKDSKGGEYKVVADKATVIAIGGTAKSREEVATDVVKYFTKKSTPKNQNVPARDKFGHFVKTNPSDVEIKDDGRDE